MRSIQTSHYLRSGFPAPKSVGLYIVPWLADTIPVPENRPLLLDHPMESLAEYLELPSSVDPLLFRPDTDVDVLGGNFTRGRDRMIHTLIQEGLVQPGATIAAVTHSCIFAQGFGVHAESLDVMEEWVQIDHLGRTKTIHLRGFSAATMLSTIATSLLKADVDACIPTAPLHTPRHASTTPPHGPPSGTESRPPSTPPSFSIPQNRSFLRTSSSIPSPAS